MLFGKKAATIGLDIGSNQIKFVEIQKTGKGYNLTNYGSAPLLPEAIVEGEIMDRTLVIDTIKDLFETNKVKGNEVVTAVSGRGAQPVPWPARSTCLCSLSSGRGRACRSSRRGGGGRRHTSHGAAWCGPASALRAA